VATWRGGRGRLDLRLSPRGVFAAVFALAFVALGCWSLADPLVAAPDEQAHMIRAYALDHGQLGHQAPGMARAYVDVTVPASVNFTKVYPQCFQFRSSQSAACAPAWTASTAPVVTDTYVGHYPPLYYALVGVGSWFSAHRAGLYLMRLASSAICALMIALSAFVIARWSRRRALVAGVAVALTPITWFLASSVNPSGFEIVTAICLWTALAVLVADHPDDPPRGLVVVIGATGATLTLVRGLSPVFVVIIAAVVVLALGPRRAWALRRRRDALYAAGAICVAGALAAVWIVTQHALSVLPVGQSVGYPPGHHPPPFVKPGTTEYAIVRAAIHDVRNWIREAVGVLGWLDTPMPYWFYDLWYWMVGTLFVGGLVFAARRAKAALVAIAVLSVLVPIVVAVHQVHVQGLVWQGRDLLPLAVGVPILGAGLWPRWRRGPSALRWVATGIVGLVTLLSLGSFYLNLRRYAVGHSGSRLFFLHSGGWSPPMGSLATLLVYAAATVALGALAVAGVRGRDGDALGAPFA
jgi:predicted membrane protein DUF2142